MDPIAYTVIATFQTPAQVGPYIAWLADHHIRDVCQAGALSGHAVLLDTAPGEPPAVEVRYLFADRETLEKYLTQHAPRLRAEGLARFGPDAGITYRRTTGIVAHAEQNR